MSVRVLAGRLCLPVVFLAAVMACGSQPASAARMPAGPQAGPAVAAWTVQRTFGLSTQGSSLPLTGPCGSLGIKNGAVIGTVQGGGISVPISATCPSTSATTLSLHLAPVPWIGRTYSGDIQVGPGAAGKVTVSLPVTTAWFWVAALILAGIVISLLVLGWTGWRRDVTQLLRRTFVIQQLVDSSNAHNADGSFQQAAEAQNLPPEVQGWTIAAAVNQRLSDVRADLRRTRRPSQQTLADTRSQLDTLEMSIRGWPDAANLLAELQHRLGRIDDLAAYQQGILSRTLRRPGPLSIPDMDDVKAAASEAVSLAADWPADAIAAARERSNALRGNEAARQAIGQLDAVFDRFRAAGTEAEAEAALDQFWQADAALRAFDTVEAREVVGLPPAGGQLTAGVFHRVDVADPARSAKGLAVRIFLIDDAVLIVLLVAALVGGMQALYVGKTFGGWWDVAAALAWGLAATAVAGPLSSALSGAGESFRTVISGS